MANLASINNFRPSLQVLSIIGDLAEFKGAWSSLSNISPERLTRLRHVATIESIGSSTRIEGSSLSDEQVERLLTGLNVQSFVTRDEEEVAGYAEAMELIFESWSSIPISENHIKQMHGILLKYSQKDARHRGKYKTVSNHVEAFDEDGKSLGVIFKTVSPFETPFRMTELVEWTNLSLEEGQLHPLIVVAVFVVAFLSIHAFQDGNGRLSRILTTLLLLKTGYATQYSSLESVIEASREHYYLALRKTQQTLDNPEPDWESWILYFLRSMQTQKNKLQQKLETNRILEGDLPALSVRILELIKEQGKMQISAMELLTQENRSTLKLRVNELLAKGKIVRHGRGRATWYSLP
jgi:Fic family protein